MTITYKNRKVVPFAEAPQGSVFVDAFSNYCMKIEYEYPNKFNVIFLEDGSTGYFNESDKVKIVDCELVVDD